MNLNFWQQQSISTWIGTTHAKFHQDRLIRYKGHPLGGQHPPPLGGAGEKFEFLTTAINFHMIQSVEYLHSYANGPQMYENIRRFFGHHTSNFSCLARHAEFFTPCTPRRHKPKQFSTPTLRFFPKYFAHDTHTIILKHFNLNYT